MRANRAEGDILIHRRKARLATVITAVITVWLLAFGSLTGISCSTANASASVRQIKENAHSLSPQARARIRRAMAAVGLVLVRSIGEELPPRPRGSAVVIHQDGIVVTNYHVICQDKSARIYDEIFFALPQDGAITRPDAPAYLLKTVLVNKEMDLALLRITNTGGETPEELSLPTVELGDSRVIRELDDLVIIGYPEKGGTTVTVNSGTVEGRDILENWIKTDARLIRGNSGGAAVDSQGRLIGIPTKVVVDRQPVDKNGDGFPDGYNALGAIGFLRPSHLVASMLAQVRNQVGIRSRATAQDAPHIADSPVLLNVSGIVRAADDGKPVAGVAIGLVPEGESEVSAKSILTWGYSNPEGMFRLNKLVPPGRYTLKAKTFGYEIFTTRVEINKDRTEMVIELRRSK